MNFRIENIISKKSPKHWTFFCCLIILFLCYIIPSFYSDIESAFVLRQGDFFFQFQIVTYSFFHINALHFSSNLIVFTILYLFIQNYFENRYIWISFILGIILGGIGFLWIPNGNSNSYLMGISSGNLGWLMVLIVNYSKSELKIGKTTFKLKYIVVFLVVFHISSLILDHSNSWQAHLGALFLLPFLYLFNKTKLLK